jgi:very-short-patch-repair endonuclease
METFICEICGKEFNEWRKDKRTIQNAPIPRFCSRGCSSVFANSKSNGGFKKGHTFNKKENGWDCSCGSHFKLRRELIQHKKTCSFFRHTKSGKVLNLENAWKKNHEKAGNCKYCGQYKKSGSGLTFHEKHCKENPDYIPSILKGKERDSFFKEKVSQGMKKAHAEGRASNWGKLRNRLQPSYPEKWLIDKIEKVFNDKNYIREMSFNKFSLDFAWIDKQLCIEMDGSQHDFDEKQIRRDKEKDKLLEETGWKVLRLRWLDCFHSPKEAIRIAKEFVDNGTIIPFEKRWISKKEQHKKIIKEKYGVEKVDNSYWDTEYERRLNLIKDYDKKKYGWVSQAIKETSLTKRQIERTCNHFNIEYRTKNK